MTHATQRRMIGGAAQAVPLSVLLAAIPSLPRPVLARLTQRLIDFMDEQDPDSDLEEDDWPGGSVDDEGEAESPEDSTLTYGTDQRQIIGAGGLVRWRDQWA